MLFSVLVIRNILSSYWYRLFLMVYSKRSALPVPARLNYMRPSGHIATDPWPKYDLIHCWTVASSSINGTLSFFCVCYSPIVHLISLASNFLWLCLLIMVIQLKLKKCRLLGSIFSWFHCHGPLWDNVFWPLIIWHRSVNINEPYLVQPCLYCCAFPLAIWRLFLHYHFNIYFLFLFFFLKASFKFFFKIPIIFRGCVILLISVSILNLIELSSFFVITLLFIYFLISIWHTCTCTCNIFHIHTVLDYICN